MISHVDQREKSGPQETVWLAFCQHLAQSRWKQILILSVLAWVFIWRGFLPGWRSLNSDFPNYYLTARLYREGYSLSRVYDWFWFQRQKDHAGIEKRVVSFIPLTLFSSLLVYPLSSLPPLKAKRCWLLVNLLLLFLSGLLLFRMTKLGAISTAILALLAIEPLRRHFLYGQFHILALFLLVVALWLYLRGWPACCGVTLALAAAIKVYPVLFVFYFLRKKQWRAVLGLVVGAVALGGVSLYLFGIEANRIYLQQILPRITKGENIDPYNIDWNSLTALLHRLFIFEPELNPHPLAHIPAAYAVLQPLAQALLFVPFLWILTPSRVEDAKEKLEYGSYAALLLLLSTNPASYQYCALILTAILAVNYLVEKNMLSKAGIFIALYALACFPLQSLLLHLSRGHLQAIFAFPRLYFTIALFILLLVILSRSSAETWASRFTAPSARVFVPMFIILWGAGTATNLRHLHGEFRNYASRLVTQPGSLMMGEPVVAENGRVAATTLMGSTYGTAIITPAGVAKRSFDSDVFHPALRAASPDVWLEVSGLRSDIVRISGDAWHSGEASARTEVENSQQPVISPDSRWMAFIREKKGRAGLWIRDLQESPAGSPRVAERELVSDREDVLDAAFDPTGPWIVFSAQPRGRAALFRVNFASGLIAKLNSDAEERYPAFSPDGRWFAYCKLEKGTWHVWLRPRDSGAERRLTTGDCNSLSPAWLPDSKNLVYATDCGRGIWMTALAEIRAVQ